MGFLEDTDVQTMLKDKTLVNKIIQAVAKAPETVSELAEDVADEIEDLLEGDPSYRRKFLKAAKSNPQFKTQVIRTLVEEITD